MSEMTKLEMKSIIRSLLISSNFVLGVDDLERDFKELVGYELPYNKFKSKSTEEYLRTIPDVCQVQGTGPSALVFPNIVPELAQKIIRIQECNEIKKKTYNGINLSTLPILNKPILNQIYLRIDLPHYYKQTFKENLPFNDYGYKEVIDICKDLTHIFIYIRSGIEGYRLY
ncbi:hypothetical protein GWI33_012436, partial [Rhynchophorus ferrugineus]